MLKGIIWLKWDPKAGILVDWQYPNNLETSIHNVVSIYASQTLGNTLIPRFSCFSSGDFNIASYYGGEAIKDMVILSLEKNVDGRNFKLQLIDYFYKLYRGETVPITNDEEFKKYFHTDLKHKDTFRKESGEFEQRFDIFLSIFNNFIKTIDNRLTQIENLILKVIEYNNKQYELDK
ncbi:MAG: hypothetical protein ACTSRG_06775 [Candidatus Helarchaeota archaeon]